VIREAADIDPVWAVPAASTTAEGDEMNRWRMVPFVVAVALMVLPSLAVAQEQPKLLTWVGFVNVKAGMDPMFEKAFDKYQAPLLNQLVADGHAASWGLGYELAGPGGYDYVVWINMPGWAGMSAVEKAFDDRYEGMSEDDLKGMMEEFVTSTEDGDQPTQLLRQQVFNSAGPEYDYLRLSTWVVKPGHGGELMQMYKDYAQPVYEQLLADGTITGYGLIEQVVHADSSFTHETWITLKDLADLDAVEAAFMAADDEVGEADHMARKLAYMKIIDPSSHHDRLLRVWKRSE
jgi:hypothetical protein